MKIITTTSTKNEWGHKETIRFEIEIVTDTSKGAVSFGNGESEDMTLSRDLSDAYSIPSMLKMAYEAGERGEKLEFEEKQEEW